MAALLTLRSAYNPDPPGHGTVDLRLENTGADAIERFRLALTSTVRLDPGPDTGVRLVRQVSGYLELAPSPASCSHPATELVITDLSVDHTPHHANDGPASAFVVLEDGSTIDVHVEPMTAPPSNHRLRRANNARSVRGTDGDPALVPWPATIDGIGRAGACPGRWAGAIGGAAAIRIERGRRRLAGGGPSGTAAPSGRAVGARRRRRHRRRRVVGVGRPGAVAPGHYEVDYRRRHRRGGRRGERRRGLPARVRHDRPTAARRVAGARADRRRADVRVARAPRRSRPPVLPGIRRRAAHRSGGVAQARSAPPPPHRRRGVAGPDRRLPRADRASAPGAGHGLPIPPLLGSPAAATGGSYTVDEIRGWVERAASSAS